MHTIKESLHNPDKHAASALQIESFDAVKGNDHCLF
jgi:hypothetical protein